MTMPRARLLMAALASLLLAACARPPVVTPPVDERGAIAGRLMADITVLASDEFGGR